MTPFGIRKKLRKLAGRGGPPEVERFPLTIVLPDGTEQQVVAEKHYTLVMASQSLPKPLATGCPDGTCGNCRVEVLDPSGLSPIKDKEREVIAQWIPDATPNTRLACHARVLGPGAKVRAFNLFDLDAITGPKPGA